MLQKPSKKFRQERKLWYRNLKRMLVARYKKPKFIYLGEKPSQGSIILSNHVGTEAPMSLEMYADFPIRMWGTAEMNSGLIQLYKYQTRVYYHEKKHKFYQEPISLNMNLQKYMFQKWVSFLKSV